MAEAAISKFRAERTKGDLKLREATKYQGKPCRKCGGTERYKSCGNCTRCINPKLSLDHRIRVTQKWGEGW